MGAACHAIAGNSMEHAFLDNATRSLCTHDAYMSYLSTLSSITVASSLYEVIHARSDPVHMQQDHYGPIYTVSSLIHQLDCDACGMF